MSAIIPKIRRVFPVLCLSHHYTAFNAFLFLSIGILITPSSISFYSPAIIKGVIISAALIFSRKTTLPFIIVGIVLSAASRDKFNSTVDQLSTRNSSTFLISYKEPPKYRSKDSVVQNVIITADSIRGTVTAKLPRPIIPGETVKISGSVSSFKSPQFPWERPLNSLSLYTGVQGILRIDSEIEQRRNLISTQFRFIDEILCSYSSQTESLLRALFLADRSLLSDGIKSLFYTGGVSHLLALSGLHIATLILIITLILSPFPIHKLHKVLILILVPWTLILFTGSTASILRSITMSSVFISAFLFRRRTSPLNTLGVAGVILLTVHPFQLFTPGFILSFTAVFSILTVSEKTVKFQKSKKITRVLLFISVPLSAGIATTPVSALFFHEICPGGIITNLTITPLFTLFFTSVSLLLPFSSLSHTAHVIIEQMTALFLRLLQFVIDFFSISVSTWTVSPLIPLAAVITLLLCFHSARQYRILVMIYSILVSITLILFIPEKRVIRTGSSEDIIFNGEKEFHEIIFLNSKWNGKVTDWLCRNSDDKDLYLTAPSSSVGQIIFKLKEGGAYNSIYIKAINLNQYESQELESENTYCLHDEDSLLYGAYQLHP